MRGFEGKEINVKHKWLADDSEKMNKVETITTVTDDLYAHYPWLITKIEILFYISKNSPCLMSKNSPKFDSFENA